jgi:hypothetical protein
LAKKYFCLKDKKMRKYLIFCLVLILANTVLAQRPYVSFEYFKCPSEYDLVGQKILLLKSANSQPYFNLQSSKLFAKAINPKDFEGKYFIIERIERNKYNTDYDYLSGKVEGVKGSFMMMISTYKGREFPLDLGVVSVLDSARKHIIGVKVYDSEDNEIIVKGIDFAGDGAPGNTSNQPFKFTVLKNGKETVIYENVAKGAYGWFRGHGAFDVDVFGYHCYAKPSTAKFSEEDIDFYFSIRQNKVDNVTEYKLKDDGGSNTTVIYEDETNLAPILIKSKGGVLSWKLVGQYYGYNFIWHKQMKITVNETSYQTPAADPITKVMEAGYVMERHVYTGAKEIALIKLIAENYNKDVAIRFIAERGGKDVDYELSEAEKYKFKRIYDLYLYLLKNKK